MIGVTSDGGIAAHQRSDNTVGRRYPLGRQSREEMIPFEVPYKSIGVPSESSSIHKSKEPEMSSSDPLIHLADVKKVFYTDEVETHALSGIHLDIKKGEYVSIAGPSGCGKSTLLSILGLLDTPTDGEYVLNDQPVENLSLSQRARIRNREVGFIFQSFNRSASHSL